MQAAYGNALFAARGPGAPETIEAFTKVRELGYAEIDASERLVADYGLFAGSYVRGELSAMRAHAETFLGDVRARSDSSEAGVAHRVAGITHWVAGRVRRRAFRRSFAARRKQSLTERPDSQQQQ